MVLNSASKKLPWGEVNTFSSNHNNGSSGGAQNNTGEGGGNGNINDANMDHLPNGFKVNKSISILYVEFSKAMKFILKTVL